MVEVSSAVLELVSSEVGSSVIDVVVGQRGPTHGTVGRALVDDTEVDVIVVSWSTGQSSPTQGTVGTNLLFIWIGRCPTFSTD